MWSCCKNDLQATWELDGTVHVVGSRAVSCPALTNLSFAIETSSISLWIAF